jgi:hypothetical protein
MTAGFLSIAPLADSCFGAWAIVDTGIMSSPTCDAVVRAFPVLGRTPDLWQN